MKLFVVLFGILSIVVNTASHAGKGLVIKLDVTDNGQQLINKNIRVPAGMKEQTHKHHVTIAYIDDNQPDAILKQLGDDIIAQLQNEFQLSETQYKQFSVKDAAQPFGTAIALCPTDESVDELKRVNSMANMFIEEKGKKCNSLTQRDKYVPHMTLSRDGADAKYLTALNSALTVLKNNHPQKTLNFKLIKWSYTIMQ